MTTATPSPTRQRPTGWIIATCVLGAAALALAVTTVVLATSDDDLGTSAEPTAASACELIAQVPEDGFDMVLEGDEVNPNLSRLAAASALAQLASELDGGFGSLFDTVRNVPAAAQQEFDATSDTFVGELGKARSACAEKGF